MPEFVVPGEDDASVFPEYFEHGKLKPEYRICPACGQPQRDGGLCDACLDELDNEF